MAYSQVPDSQTFVTQVPRSRLAGEIEFVGPQTLDKPSVRAVGAVAATGSTVADAALVPTTGIVRVTAADGTKGVILPTSGPGTSIDVYNTAASALKVYPPTGGTINGGSANAAITVAAKIPARLFTDDGVNWAATFT